MLAEKAERKAKIQFLDDALTAKGLPPYKKLGNYEKWDKKLERVVKRGVLLDVLTTGGTRLSNLFTSGPIDEHLSSEINSAVEDCAIVQKNMTLLDEELANFEIRSFRKLPTVCQALLVKDAKLKFVFRPTGRTRAVTIKSAITDAVLRLSPVLKARQRGISCIAVPRSMPILCYKCTGNGHWQCRWSMCQDCCYDRFCEAHSL